MEIFKIANKDNFAVIKNEESFQLQIGTELYDLIDYPQITKLDSNNYIVSEIQNEESTHYLVNVMDDIVLDLRFMSKNILPIEYDENLLNAGVIIIRPNVCYLYSFNYGIVISSDYDEMNILNNNSLAVNKKTYHDTYEGVIDFNGHLINEELYSPKLDKYTKVDEHNLGKSINDLDKKIILLKNHDYHDYLEDQAHLYKRIKSK